MSISSVEVIKNRIKSATADSPITVFGMREKGVYNAVFTSTRLTNKAISIGSPSIVGTYHGEKGVKLFQDDAKQYETFLI